MKNLNKIISEVFKIHENDLSEGLTSNDIIDWDSLGQFALISRLEKEYHVTFEIDELFSIVTIGDIRNILKNKIDSK